jgi:hypothetical protein
MMYSKAVVSRGWRTNYRFNEGLDTAPPVVTGTSNQGWLSRQVGGLERHKGEHLTGHRQ